MINGCDHISLHALPRVKELVMWCRVNSVINKYKIFVSTGIHTVQLSAQQINLLFSPWLTLSQVESQSGGQRASFCVPQLITGCPTCLRPTYIFTHSSLCRQENLSLHELLVTGVRGFPSMTTTFKLCSWWLVIVSHSFLPMTEVSACLNLSCIDR